MSGTIIQVSRGIILVLLMVWLRHCGYEHLEPRAGRKARSRRFLMAVVMICFMCFYFYAWTLMGNPVPEREETGARSSSIAATPAAGRE